MRRKILQVLLSITFLGMFGCDITQAPEQVTESYQEYIPKSISGTYRCSYNVVVPDSVIETDSTERFSYSDSGTYSAFLVRTTWIGNNSSCSLLDRNSVIGGVSGIKRYFGRWKNAPQNPNYNPQNGCVDCDW